MADFFRDKVAIVTGASSGIGEAAARLMIERGARVVLAARRKKELERLGHGVQNAFAIETDVTRAESVKNLVTKTLERFGRIDILVNNAGALLYKPMLESSLAEVRAVMETNFFGAVECAHAAAAVMRRQKSGVIVNVASVAGRVGFPNLGYYGASKFAIVGFSETLRQEVAHAGIKVVTFCPGTVYTPMTQDILDKARAKGKRVMAVPAEAVARRLLLAAERGEKEVFYPPSTHLLYLLHVFFPAFVEWLAWKFRASEPSDFAG